MSGYVMLKHLKLRRKQQMNVFPYKWWEKLLEKYKAIWTIIEDLKNIKLHALPVYDDRYIKTKTRTFGDKVYINFRSINVQEDYIECESFTVISIDSLLVYNKKYYLQGYLHSCAYKI